MSVAIAVLDAMIKDARSLQAEDIGASLGTSLRIIVLQQARTAITEAEAVYAELIA